MNKEGVKIKGIISKNYDGFTRSTGFGKNFMRKVIVESNVELEDKKRILDAGCGTGTLLMVLGKEVETKMELYGIDLSERQLKQAISKAKKEKLEINYHLGSVGEMPYQDNYFDVIFCTMMFHHLPEGIKDKALGEYRRVLKENGKLVLVDWCPPKSFLMKLFYSPLLLLLLLWPPSRANAQGKIAKVLKERGFNVQKEECLKPAVKMFVATLE